MLHLYIHTHIHTFLYSLTYIISISKEDMKNVQDKISGTFYLCNIFFSYRAVCVVLTINIAFIFISAKAMQDHRSSMIT